MPCLPAAVNADSQPSEHEHRWKIASSPCSGFSGCSLLWRAESSASWFASQSSPCTRDLQKGLNTFKSMKHRQYLNEGGEVKKFQVGHPCNPTSPVSASQLVCLLSPLRRLGARARSRKGSLAHTTALSWLASLLNNQASWTHDKQSLLNITARTLGFSRRKSNCRSRYKL